MGNLYGGAHTQPSNHSENVRLIRIVACPNGNLTELNPNFVCPNFVLFIQILFCLSKFCFVYSNFVLFIQILFCLSKFCFVYPNFVLFIQILFCLSKFCFVYPNFVLFIQIFLNHMLIFFHQNLQNSG